MSDHVIEQLWEILKSEISDDEAEFIRLLGQHRWTVQQLDARKILNIAT